MILANNWSPEQWAILVGSITASLGAMITGIIVALKTTAVHSELRPPSNGATLGALVEGIGQVQSTLIGLQHPDVNIPSAMKMARELQTADPATPSPVERRDNPPAVTNG